MCTFIVSLHAAVKPNIADISAISATHIDETAFTRTRLGDTTMETFEVLDLTCAPAELFLLSCRVYISQAIKGPLLDKCRTIINTAGATRYALRPSGKPDVVPLFMLHGSWTFLLNEWTDISDKTSSQLWCCICHSVASAISSTTRFADEMEEGWWSVYDSRSWLV